MRGINTQVLGEVVSFLTILTLLVLPPTVLFFPGLWFWEKGQEEYFCPLSEIVPLLYCGDSRTN